MMRIGVDARELRGRPTGTGRYLRELIVRWQRDPACHGAELVLFTPDGSTPAAWPTSERAGASVTWRHVPGSGGTMWEQRALAAAVRGSRLDVCFSPAYTAPLRLAVPLVLSVHDVSFAAHPEWYAWRHGLRLRTVSRWSARLAHTVLTLSAFSASEIRRHFRVGEDRIRIVPLAVDYHDAPPAPLQPAPVAPVVLFVGSVFERRHLPLLIEGVARARAYVPDLRLDVIGDNRTSPRIDLAALGRRLGLGEAIRLRDYVSDAELAQAYSTSGAFAFLSEYEGFGLTPLEAMRYRLPTIVLDTPVAREVYGTGARYVTKGAGDVCAALIDLLRKPDMRAAQIEAGDRAVARYRWSDAARATWQAIVEAAGARR